MKQVSLVLCCSFIIALVLAGCDMGLTNTVQPTPTAFSFVPLPLDIPSKALNAPISGNVPDSQQLHVGITLKINQLELDQMSKNGIAKPGDITSASDIAKKLGISEASYQQFKQFFGVSGANLSLSGTHTSMTLDIKASALAQLLQTRFVLHRLNNRTFYTPDSAHMPRIPALLANHILAVTGLDNYSLPPTPYFQVQPQPARQSAGNKQTVQSSTSCDTGTAVNWKQLAHTYGYDQMWQKGWHGENMTINLVEFEGVNPNDLRTYFACTGFKGSVDFITMGNAASFLPPSGEATLDIEMIAGLAPAAHIKVYQADSNTMMIDVLQRILDDNVTHPDLASTVSISWGGSEDTMTSEVKAINQRLQLLTEAQHMTVYAASGDCGAFDDYIPGSLSVDYPASSPWAVSVGGTQIVPNPISHNASGEIAWTTGATTITDGIPLSLLCHNEWGSGGGLSKFFKKPAWQQATGVNNQHSNGYRQLPDIAALAWNIPLFFQGKWQQPPSGGTSAATPIWAAGIALVNQGLLATKDLYAYGPDTFYFVQDHAGNLKPYYDEVVGFNGYYTANSGWDYVTGLGSPNLPAFYQVIYNNASIGSLVRR
jgi:kumamolisin